MNKEKIKGIFEANFLDGDKISDCGVVGFTASGALEVAEFFYEKGQEEKIAIYEELIEDVSEVISLIKCLSNQSDFNLGVVKGYENTIKYLKGRIEELKKDE